MKNFKVDHFNKREDKLVLSEEINAILRAADDIIACGGRTLLAKILKGSKDKKVLQLGLEQNPCYGFFRALKIEEIVAKIDWMIIHDFLEIQYSGKLPMLVFTEKGWILERDQYANELLRQWDEWLAQGIIPESMEYLKDRNRGLILLFLEKIRQTGDERYIPLLEQWVGIEYKKVRQAICRVINHLQSPGDSGCKRIQTEPIGAGELAELLKVDTLTPEVLKCWECGKKFVWSEEEQKFFKLKGFVPPKRCPVCRDTKWLGKMGVEV